MAERWTLCRAGITNVYQYTDEILRFGGGRLLLRGVNGSGKSTAMNMLLPFLLDADVRRIDAAGDQSGVLASWMLTGRDETQPTGYLWLEMERGDNHLVFGCGIKANRNTGNVTHWWFVTDRRPGVDLHLVRATGSIRTPLSAEELRQELGPGQVWSMDQRPAYRAALHGRLYGGADLDQHIRLLHIVRNPRVGDRVDDRIDVGLTAHLHDALPQLSEAAIDDAATPLEQLDEHRRNVSDLTVTVTTLDALLASYRDHVRSTLGSMAEAALTQVSAHRSRESQAKAAVEAEADARARVAEIEAAIEGRSADERRLTGEIAQLEASEAYANASELALRRDAVSLLQRAAAERAAARDEQADVAADDRREVSVQEAAAEDQVRRLDEDLGELAAGAVAASLPSGTPAPSRPEISVAPLTVADDVVSAPTSAFSTEELARALAAVRTASQTRTAEIADADRALAQVETALTALEQADARRREAEAVLAEADATVTTRRAELRATAESWRSDAARWLGQLADHAGAVGLPASDPIDVADADVEATHAPLHGELLGAVDQVLERHRTARATTQAALSHAEAALADVQQRVDELASLEVPDPPAAAWQGDRTNPCLAEVVEFADSLTDGERAGLEAALEASGLLMAEVRSDGALAVGDLVVAAGDPVAQPLSGLLSVSVPAGHPHLSASAVERVLDGIATETIPTASAAQPSASPPGTTATVTVSGEFQVGPLRGQHSKPVAEHVGVSARRAALERMRAEAADLLAAAVGEAERLADELSQIDGHIAAARDLRAAIPSTAPLVTALAAAAEAERRRAQATDARDDADERREDAERAHGRAADHAHRVCTSAGLPTDRAALAEVREACRRIPDHVERVDRSAAQLASAVARWTGAGERWVRSRQKALAAAARADDARHEHERAAAELATLEDAIGLDVQELFATLDHARGELRDVRSRLAEARRSIGPATKLQGRCESEVRRADDELAASEASSLVILGRLRAAVAVPGAWAAAGAEPADTEDTGDEPGVTTDETVEGDEDVVSQPRDTPPPVSLPPVPTSTSGLLVLATAIGERVPPAVQIVTPDGVRNALLQRRSTLGAGWDAVSHHPEPDLPLAIEVNGPLGQMPLARAAAVAAAELATKRSLLTAQQTDALRNLLQGLVAKEVAEKLHAAGELVDGMNERLREVRTTHGIGTSLRWRRRDDLPDDVAAMVDLLAKPSDLRTHDEDARLVDALSARIADARADEPEADYRTLITKVLDYRDWHRLQVILHRPGQRETVLSRRTPLSEGEKKIVSYQPLFAAVAASCDALAESAPDAPRFVLLDDAFAKVSEDNHPKLFGLLVELDLDFIATSERLWGTHATVPELAITEVVRDADAGVIVLEHSHWDGHARRETS